MNRKKVWALAAVCVCLALCAVVGLGAQTKDLSARAETPKRVIATIYPQYDWLLRVLGDNPAGIEARLLVDNGTDLHSFQPSVDDVIAIGQSDMLLFVGGESDQWILDVLNNAANPDRIDLNMMRALGDAVVAETLVEGMQGDAEEGAYDEHIWLSLANARTLVGAIRDAVASLDPAHADVYARNASAYMDELAALDDAYRDTVAGAKYDTILFADRFPFRYLAEEYDLKYYAAFAGCSAETEASFETIIFLSDKLKELALPAILVMENSDRSIARTVADNAGRGDVPILVLDSIQSVTEAQAQAGYTYLDAMRANRAALAQALGREGNG